MVGQYSNSFALFSLTSSRTILSSLMMPTKRQRNISCQWLNFLRRKGWCLLVKCINGSRLSSYISLKNMWNNVVLDTCVGALTISWKNNPQQHSLKIQKAPICRRSFFNIVRCEGSLNNSTLASCGFTCNNSEVL